ncbi:MAG: gamma-glutamyl-gamma-aminobutyrate hydrolase family protein [Candidatus Moranbacteria bacterium]|nr:gamma-glutamyl-gamma-aminobutyrate hydrolase family protein [Candidatus Moranbacteria bacterium]
MNILLIDNQTKHLEKICRLLPDTPTVVPWNKLSATDALGRDLIILSGGTNVPSVTEYEEFFLIQKSIILGSEKPIIGICLGAQIIANAFDAELEFLGKKRQGIITVLPTETGTRILSIHSPFQVYEGHSWAIKKLPESFDVLAESEDGKEIFKHSSRPLWGLQFHPEHLIDQTSGDEIFLRILNDVKG